MSYSDNNRGKRTDKAVDNKLETVNSEDSLAVHDENFADLIYFSGVQINVVCNQVSNNFT